jgi:hypothetical protein
VSEREIGDLHARVEHLEAEVEKLRVRSHKHASAIQATSSKISVGQELVRRVRSIENWKSRWAWVLGVVAGISAVIGVIIGKVF